VTGVGGTGGANPDGGDDGGAGLSGVGGSPGASAIASGGIGVVAIGGAGTSTEPAGTGINASAGTNKGGGAGLAGYFGGDVDVAGNLTVTGTVSAETKNFKIDDPLDPANKYLVHTSVESPDAEDVYNGNITTNANGYATVHLPAYFDALNIDPRYQLTVISSNGWMARVVKPVSNNEFEIQTDDPGVTVSWQVTGTRNDPYSRSVRGPAQQWKPAADRGKYLYPAGYAQPASRAIYRATKPPVAAVTRHPMTASHTRSPAAKTPQTVPVPLLPPAPPAAVAAP